MSHNLFAYCMNDPVNNVDSTGHVVDTLLDAGFIAWDIVDIINNPGSGMNWAALGADVGCLFVPFATGGGRAVKLAAKGAELANKAADISKFVQDGGILVDSYSALRKGLKGTGLQAHHLIEKRFADILGIAPNDMLSVALTKEQHQIYTNRWRTLITYGKKGLTKEYIMDIAKQVYYDAPDLLRLVESAY
jgi:hypothetical protein